MAVKGLKCPVCADRAVLEGYNDLATTDKALLKEWPYELNTDVEPTKITRNSLRPVWWRCKYGHTWKEKIAKRTIEGERCPMRRRVCSCAAPTPYHALLRSPWF